MQSLGEIDILVIAEGKIVLRLRALVVKHLQVDVYAGTTFHVDNGVVADISKGMISLHQGKFIIKQNNPVIPGGPLAHPPPALTLNDLSNHNEILSDRPTELSNIKTLDNLVHQIQELREEIKLQNQPSADESKIIMKPATSPTIFVKDKKSVLPGDVYKIKLNSCSLDQEYVTVMPQFHKIEDLGPEWTPQVCKVEDACALYHNESDKMLSHRKGVHFYTMSAVEMTKENLVTQVKTRPLGPDFSKPCDIMERLAEMKINKKIMTAVQIDKLNEIHRRNQNVFNDDLTDGYSDHSARINFKQETQAPPYKLWAPQFNRKCQDLLQSKCDQLEHQGVLADPIDHGINVRNVSPCFIQQKARAKFKKLEDCTLEEIRFISCFNVLNDSIRPIASISSAYETITKFLSRHKFFIFADLLNSYFQIKIDAQDWKHLGIMTPYRDLKVLTRLGQGLLNSDVILDQVLCRVLGDEISAGFCLAARDDLFVGGDSIDEVLENWDNILTKLEKANLKITARKVRVFLEDTEVFGHRVINGKIIPSDHTVNTLGDIKMEEIKTIKQLNSWRGLYKTLIQHLPDLASMMAPFDKVAATKPASESFDWTVEGRVAAFNRAKAQIKKINALTLPRPGEKLTLMPDTACEDNCTGWVLYTERNGKNLPAQFCSAKLQPYMQGWFPCEKEGVGAVLAIDQCKHWINESLHSTTVLADNKPVVEAANMMKLGRHSKSPRLQSLLASVNRSNVQFLHSSAKAGDHVVPDRLSRMKLSCGADDCQVERYLDDIPAKIQCMATFLQSPNLEDLIFAEINPAILGASSAELSEILCRGRGSIPIGSRAAWLEIQRSNEECRKYLDQVKYGGLPGKKDSAKANLNKMRKNCVIEKGLIVCKSFDSISMRERPRIFVPGEFLKSILTIIHVRLDHISAFQLENVFNRYFFGISTNSTCEQISSECNLCISLKKFPKQLEQFSPKLVPEHPGSHMNADVIRRASQKILVNTDLFSGYTSACLLSNEQKEEMVRGLILLITPVRHSPEITVRVDSASALKALQKSGHSDLLENGIKLVLGDDMNKNSNCCVDKKIQELEMEIKRLCQSESKITLATLSRAVTNLNSRIRNQGLTASQIHFSRDSITGENLNLNDEKLMEDKLEKRNANHLQSARSKAPKGKIAGGDDYNPGDIAYVMNQGTKHESRNPYLVTGQTQNKVRMHKILHPHASSKNGPSISSEVKTVDSKFLFKSKTNVTPVKISVTANQNRENYTDKVYIIPQRRYTRNSSEIWTPTQSAECATDDDDDDDMLNDELSVMEAQNTIDSIDEEHSSASDDDTENDDSDNSINLAGEVHLSETELEESFDGEHSNVTSEDRVEIVDDQYQVNQRVDQSDEADAEAGAEGILLFDDGQGAFIPERLCQHKLPKLRDRVAIYNQVTGAWVNATLTSNTIRGYKDYYNCVYDDGVKDGMYLHMDQRWTFIENSCCDECAGITDAPVPIAQVDGIHIPGSLTPTPETTPEKDSPSYGIRLGPADYLQSDTSDEASSVAVLDKSFTASPEWDAYGTELESPLGYNQPSQHVSRLDRAADLSLVLPLTSTPIPTLRPRPTVQRRPRVSALRRSLPIESEKNEDDDNEEDGRPKFLSKLNPFKKKDR